MAKKEWHTADLYNLLAAKYPAPQYAFIGEVPNATSINKTRSADAIAMGCWESVGILLNGFEIKVSRSDWLKELKDLSKSYAFQRFCHRWWIVAAPGIVKPEEMPAEWGLLLPHGTGLRVKKAAALREPERPDHDFLAGWLRRIVEAKESASEVKKAFKAGQDKGWKDGLKYGEDKARSEIARNSRAEKKLRETVDRFEEQSGVKITEWGNGDIGKAVKLLQSLRGLGEPLIQEFEEIHQRAVKVADAVDELKNHVGTLNPVKQESN